MRLLIAGDLLPAGPFPTKVRLYEDFVRLGCFFARIRGRECGASWEDLGHDKCLAVGASEYSLGDRSF
jgi:hypothetical protein